MSSHPSSGSPPRVVGATEQRLQFLDELAEVTKGASEPAVVLAMTARMLGQHLGASRCAYAQVEEDQDHFELLGDYNRGVSSIVGRYAFSDFGDAVRELMRADRPYINADVDRDERTAGGDLSAYRATQIQAVICVPLHKSARFVAAMAVHQDAPRDWRDEEIQLVQTVVSRCWESLERLRVERALRDANQRLSLALAAGHLGDWSWDAASDVVTLSDGAAEVFALPAGRPLAWAELGELMHPEDRGRVRAAVEQAAAGNTLYDIEYRLRLEGGVRWVAAQGKPTYAAGGALVGMIGVVRDITQRRLAQEKARHEARMLEQLNEDMQRTSALKDEFLATLSHELRTPLSAILGWVHILKRRFPDAQAELSKGIEVIERNARAQTQLIEDLLDMSRITSGQLRLDVQPVEPLSFIEAAVETVRPAAEAAGVRLQCLLDPAAGPVSGDPGRLQQVVWNLLSNAVKFTPRDGTVQVLLERLDSQVEITVADTGMGIQPEFLAHIFDRFRQADGSSTRRFGGLGLGLAIVRQLVELHGGSVHAESPGVGQGATFVIQLPLQGLHAEPAAGERVDPQAMRQPPGLAVDELGGLRVLVIDDEQDARELLQMVLGDCGAEVRVAADAQDALLAVQEFRPDVLVSDIGMPGMDGYALLHSVRALGPQRGGEVPAIALTAFARSEDRVRALRAGYRAHVAKPVEPAEIVATIASLVRRPQRPAAGSTPA